VNQSKLESFIEQVFNVGSGFVISILLWEYVVKSMLIVGWITIDSTIAIALIFTVVSIIRGYFWRRFFNKGIHKMAHRLASRKGNSEDEYPVGEEMLYHSEVKK